jgi:hypothetical protein
MNTTKAQEPEEIAALRRHIASKDCDVFAFMGKIAYPETSAFVDLVCGKDKKKKNAILYIATLGGDPDSAFRVIRGLKRHYSHVSLAVPGICKSAGTLLALGADEVILGPTGELGPLDVQVLKPDEVVARNSGLDLFQALAITTNSAFQVFERWMFEISEDTNGAISAKTAAEISERLVIGLFQPLMQQLDPHRIGEIQRALNIVEAYAQRLGAGNLKERAITKLVTGYPSHGFVIDLDEAKTVFKNVRSLQEDEKKIASLFGREMRHFGAEPPRFFDASKFLPTTDEAANGTKIKPDGNKASLPKRVGSSKSARKNSQRAVRQNGSAAPEAAKNGGRASTAGKSETRH